MLRTRASVRAFSVATAAVFFIACTKYVPIEADSIVDGRHLDGTIAFHLVDKRTIVSDDVTISEAGFEVRRVHDDGNAHDISPMLIERTNVESMELVTKNYRPLWIAGGAVLFVGMLFFVMPDQPGWGD